MILAAPTGKFRGALASVARFAPWALLGALTLALLAWLLIFAATHGSWNSALYFALPPGFALFLLMLSWSPNPPVAGTAPMARAIGRAMAGAFHVAPWAGLAAFGVTIAAMTIDAGGSRDFEGSNAWWVRALATVFLCLVPLMWLSPLVVGGDLVWRLVRRTSLHTWASAMARYIIGMALVCAVLIGNAFGLMELFWLWFG